MKKDQLRKIYKKQRSALSPIEVGNKSFAIANQLLRLPIWHHSLFHVFLSIKEKKEVDTSFILQMINARDKNIAVPKWAVNHIQLEHYLLKDSTLLKTNQFNIPEPQNGIKIEPDVIDVIFVPLLAFDVKGNRVGYGKGCYDFFLSECKKEAVKIGLSFFDAEPLISDLNARDVLLDYCVTPEQIYQF